MAGCDWYWLVYYGGEYICFSGGKKELRIEVVIERIGFGIVSGGGWDTTGSGRFIIMHPT